MLELGEDREILVNLTVSNTGDPAYFAWVHLNFSSVFSYIGRSDSVTDILCDLQEGTSLRCNLGNPFLQRTETLQFKLVPLYSPRLPSDVMFTTNYFLQAPLLRDMTGTLDKFSAVLGAALHDFAHPGLSNPFLIATRSPEAIMYNNQSYILHPPCYILPLTSYLHDLTSTILPMASYR